MRNFLYLIIGVFMLSACREPEPRKPVQVKSGSFFKTSVERSQKILKAETAAIQKIISKDTLNTYISSKSGFWYAYEKKVDSSGYLPKSNDVILLTFNLMSLNGDTIYKVKDIGLVEHAVDKSQLFPGLRNAVKLLRKGEAATFIFPSSQGYGYKGDGDKIGPNMPLKSSVNLIEIKKDSSNINL